MCSALLNSLSFLFQDAGSYIMVIVDVFSDFLSQFIEVYLGLNVCKARPCPVGLTDLLEILYQVLQHF